MKLDHMQQQIIAPYRIDPAWLVTASSFLADRIIPDCERIHLPAREVHGGILSYGRGLLQPAPVPEGRLATLRPWRRSPETIPAPHEDVFDLRRNTPANWAHFLNNHLPIFFTVCARLAISPREALLVLPEQIPGYILDMAALLGLKTLATDAQIDGNGVLYEADPWTGIRPMRHTWVDTPVVHEAIARLDRAQQDAPRRVFLSRRDTRAPTNEAEIMEWLRQKGFAKVYPEDLSPAQQIHLFRHAEIMVAVHGAGLAPLLYMQPGGRLRHLVEILHAGHMTDVYRVMAHQVDVQWIGVRGRLKPQYIKDAYDIGSTYKAHSLDNFEIDLSALETAFDMAGIA